MVARGATAAAEVVAITSLPSWDTLRKGSLRHRPEDRAQAVNDRIEDFAEALEAVQADAPVGEGAPRADETHRFDVSVAAIAQQEVGVVGRICADGDGRLSEGSIALEGSTGRSRGASVALDLSRVPAFSVFPGQVVAVRGLNPTGRAFLAQSIATAYPDGARPGRSGKGAGGVRGAQADMPQGAVRVVAASGPFASSPDQDPSGLTAVLTAAATRKADLVVLTGPFLDAESPAVREGRLGEALEDVFARHVAAKVGKFQRENPTSRVVLIPSPRDALADPEMPQAPLDDRLLEGLDPAGVLSMPNPCLLAWLPPNDGDRSLVIGAVTADVVKHLAMAEVSRNMGADRVGRLCQHLVDQRCFYPVAPSPMDADGIPSALIESTLSKELMMSELPHVLLMPSTLPPHAKALQSGAGKVWCVNPGVAAKLQCAVVDVLEASAGPERVQVELLTL